MEFRAHVFPVQGNPISNGVDGPLSTGDRDERQQEHPAIAFAACLAWVDQGAQSFRIGWLPRESILNGL